MHPHARRHEVDRAERGSSGRVRELAARGAGAPSTPPPVGRVCWSDARHGVRRELGPAGRREGAPACGLSVSRPFPSSFSPSFTAVVVLAFSSLSLSHPTSPMIPLTRTAMRMDPVSSRASERKARQDLRLGSAGGRHEAVQVGGDDLVLLALSSAPYHSSPAPHSALDQNAATAHAACLLQGGASALLLPRRRRVATRPRSR